MELKGNHNKLTNILIFVVFWGILTPYARYGGFNGVGILLHAQLSYWDPGKQLWENLFFRVSSCSVMFRHDPSCSAMFRHVPSCSVVFRRVPSRSVMFRPVLSCSVLFRPVPSCSVLFRHVPSCSVMFRHVPSCSVMFRRVPSCSVMFRHVPSCSVMFHQAPRRLTWISRSSNPGRPGWTPAAPLNLAINWMT